MTPQVASIQSFFQPEVSLQSSSPQKRSNVHQSGTRDGFTSSEVEAALRPALHEWQPRTDYEAKNITDLNPGPGCITVTGRVVNLSDQSTQTKMLQAAKGCLRIIVKDDTGPLTVKLLYAKTDYRFYLGQLVSVWTSHISNADSKSLTPHNASLITLTFPEQDNTCYISLQEETDQGLLCKTPLGYREGEQLDSLVNLKNYMDGGSEIAGVKLLACVKSIGGRKKFTTKQGSQMERVDVHIFDDTAEATLTLWGCTALSASYWKPSSTVLLFSNAAFKNDKRPTITLSQATHVDVDPIFDPDEAARAEVRILFTLADIDDFCGVPIFANTVNAKCKQCERDVVLRINPRLVGLLIDETGGIACGKLIWSDEAWEQLLGRNAEEFVAAISNIALLKYLDNRLLSLRLAVMFGWSEEVGKLVILRVEII